MVASLSGFPSSQHGVAVDRVRAVLVLCHCGGYHAPRDRVCIGWRQQRIGVYARVLADVSDVVPRVVLAWRCPARDDGADRAQVAAAVVAAQDDEGRAPAVNHRCELTKGAVRLPGPQPFPPDSPESPEFPDFPESPEFPAYP